jgi:hypothetical protein
MAHDNVVQWLRKRLVTGVYKVDVRHRMLDGGRCVIFHAVLSGEYSLSRTSGRFVASKRRSKELGDAG